MTQSELRKLYLSVTYLYGYVYSSDLFKILDHYEIKYKKEQILKDLQDRCTKRTRYFCVQKMKGSSYLIINSIYDNEEFQELKSQKKGKPMYFPKTYDGLLLYSSGGIVDKKEKEGLDNIILFLKRHSKMEETKLMIIASIMMLSMKKALGENVLEETFQWLEICDIELNEKTMNRFIKIIENTNNNLRLPSNNGFTPNEMLGMRGPIDPNKVVFSIGPNIRESFLDGTSDPYEFLKELEDANLPLNMKESLKAELLSIIDEINKMPKA